MSEFSFAFLKTKNPLFVIILFLFSMVAYTPIFAEQEKTSEEETQIASEKQKKPAGRPDHSFDLFYSMTAEKADTIRFTASDKLPSFDETLPIFNTLSAEKRTFTGSDSPDVPLYRVSESVMMRNNRWMFLAAISCNSDKPVHDSGIPDLFGAAAKNVLSEGNHSLYLGVFASRKKLFHIKYNIPLPFASYFYRDEQMRISIGLPTSLFLKLPKKFSFSFLYMPVRNIESSLLYNPLPFITLSIDYAWKVDSYTLSDRVERDDRFFHEYMNIKFRIQSYVSSHAGVYLAGGYLFGEKFFTGKDTTDYNNTVSVKNSPFFEAGALLFF